MIALPQPCMQILYFKPAAAEREGGDRGERKRGERGERERWMGTCRGTEIRSLG